MFEIGIYHPKKQFKYYNLAIGNINKPFDLEVPFKQGISVHITWIFLESVIVPANLGTGQTGAGDDISWYIRYLGHQVSWEAAQQMILVGTAAVCWGP